MIIKPSEDELNSQPLKEDNLFEQISRSTHTNNNPLPPTILYQTESKQNHTEPRSLVFQFTQYQRQVSPQLTLRYRKQLNEMHQIFTHTQLRLPQQPQQMQHSIIKTQYVCFHQIKQRIAQYLSYPREERFKFQHDLEQVPDLWLSQQLNQIMEELLQHTEHLYLHDVQQLLDHEVFLKQHMHPHAPFKMGKELKKK